MMEAWPRTPADPVPRQPRCTCICTEGWAGGVQIAASVLQHGRPAQEALREADRLVSSLVWSTALAPLPSDVLRLLTATSMLDEVSPDLAAAVSDEPVDDQVNALDIPSGFVEQDLDGTFRCHPLLRRVLRRRLARTPELRRQVILRAARRLHERGESARVLELAVQAEDWEWASAAGMQGRAQ